MRFNYRVPALQLTLCLAFSPAFCGLAIAEEGEPTASAPPSPIYKQECSACHVAYPPAMLPAESWRRILGNLSNHFGTNASLDSASVAEITRYLAAYANRGQSAPPDDRITRSEWFVREHDEVRSAYWKLPAVKSASNCIACHTQAEKGNFDERFTRIPK
jgi:mono/diheme cytochrome c family protein